MSSVCRFVCQSVHLYIWMKKLPKLLKNSLTCGLQCLDLHFLIPCDAQITGKVKTVSFLYIVQAFLLMGITYILYCTFQSMEYSTLKELSLGAENLRICLHEANSLITCFWTSSLPNPDSTNPKLRAEVRIYLHEANSLITCFWTSSLPNPDSTNPKLRAKVRTYMVIL